MTEFYNVPPTAVGDSLRAVVEHSFAYAKEGDPDWQQPDVFLAGQFAGDGAVSGLARAVRNATEQLAVVNTLDITTGVAMRRSGAELAAAGIPQIVDYSDPQQHGQAKRVVFYPSEVCGPFLRHVYSQVASLLAPLCSKYGVTLAPIGSDTLPQFPSKLDSDIVACAPQARAYRGFVGELLDSGVFEEPRSDLSDSHRFLYSEMLGTPIDLHTAHGTLVENKLYRQVRQLGADPATRQRYADFKRKMAGVTIVEYRSAKAAFRKEIGWD